MTLPGAVTGLPTTGLPITTLPGALPPNVTLPTTTPSTFAGLQCVTGRVQILLFTQGIPQTDVFAQLTTITGQTLLLATSSPVIRGQLSAVDGRFATVCGTLVIRNNQLALLVQVVIPQQVTPPINPQQLLLLLLLLFFSRGQIPFGTLGTTGLGALVNQFGGQAGLQQALTQLGGATAVTNLVNQLGGETAILSQLQQSGIGI